MFDLGSGSYKEKCSKK